MRSRLFIRVFGTCLVLIIVAVSILYILVGNRIRTSSIERIEEELLTYCRIIDLGFTIREIRPRVLELSKIAHARLTLIDAEGIVLADSEAPGMTGSHLDRPEIQEARTLGKGSSVRFSGAIGMDMLYVSVLIETDGRPAGYLRLARPLHEVRQSMQGIYRGLFMAILIMIIPSILLALLFSYRISAPIRQMEVFTERLRRGEQPGTLMIRTGDEMHQLASNINYLVEELRAGIQTATEEKGKLLAAFASMNEGVLLLDAEDRIEICNRAFRQMISSRYGDVRGKTLLEAFRNVELENALDKFKSAGEPLTEEIALGEPPLILDVTFSEIRGQQKTLLVFHDVTRLKKLEKIRMEFISNVNHEIKTPLTAIIGYIETLREGKIDDAEAAKGFLEIIHRNALRLNRLVEDLLTISSIEMGEMPLKFEAVSPENAVENALQLIRKKADEKQIDIAREIPGGLPRIRADRDRVIQVLVNILDNAVKFTDKGGHVTISAARDGETVTVRIEDTGIGVPRVDLPRLGERFYRVDQARSRELGGTGLGLSIVKHLMNAHQGRMEITSEPGRGTTVALWFPVFQ